MGSPYLSIFSQAYKRVLHACTLFSKIKINVEIKFQQVVLCEINQKAFKELGVEGLRRGQSKIRLTVILLTVLSKFR
jgi:hypothetical protein